MGGDTKVDERKLTRRELVERMLAGMAAGAAWPLLASAHPIHEHLKNAALLDRADVAHKSADWKLLFLDTKQSESLGALAETMVPGSAKAQVNRFIDLLLSVDSKKHQQEFVGSLAALESGAEKHFGRRFPALTVSEQESMLTDFSHDESEHFENLKEWIAGAYYSSEEGMRELGWDGKHAFAKFPGCEHAGEPH